MQKWEYKVLALYSWPSEAQLNELGKVGWELVSVVVDAEGDATEVRAYLKRLISN